MTKRRSILSEAIAAGQFEQATQKITRFFATKLGTKRFYAYPTPEQVVSGGQRLVGIRYFAVLGGEYISFRMNWGQSGVKMSSGLKSVDYWPADYGASQKSKKDDGTKVKRSSSVVRLTFTEEASLVQTLPMIVDLLKNKFESVGKGEITYIEESVKLSLKPTMVPAFDDVKRFLCEEVVISGDLRDTVDAVIQAFKDGKAESAQYKEGGSKMYGPGWFKTVKTIIANYDILGKEGRVVTVNLDVAKTLRAGDVMELMGSGGGMVRGKIGAAPAETVVSASMTADELEKMSYSAQLESLKSGVKLLLSGASNALFIVGRGGTGKTQNVEDELAAAGLKDGSGYTVVKGSASTAGLYRIMFQNRNGILLFDDSDGALADQDSRNLFKAAADTKPVRKLSWQKGGGSYIDADDYDEEEDGDKLPRSFEFKGKIIFISNLSFNKLDPDGALRTRAFVIPIDPVDQDMIDFMRQISMAVKLDVNYVLGKKERDEVVDLIAARVSTVDSTKSKLLNLRMLIRALNTRAGIEMSGGTRQEWVNFVTRFI